jgi:hypothetical protein
LRCPMCGSGQVFMVLAGGGLATCQSCGASWSSENVLERRTSPESPSKLLIPPKPMLAVEVPVEGVSAFEIGMDIVSMLVRDHAATVLEYDIGASGGSLRLRLPAPIPAGAEANLDERAVEGAVTEELEASS